MELLPLLVLDPTEPAILPGERRRLLLTEERMVTAVRLALRDGGRLAVLAWDPAQRREGEGATAPDVERLLPVATACRLIRGEVEGFAVVRGEARVVVAGTSSGGCCDHDDPYAEGTEARCEPFPSSGGDEAAWEDLAALLRSLDLPVHVRAGAPLEARIDRVARALALVPWVQAEVLAAGELAVRIRRLADAAVEMAAPGASFRASELDAPYRSAEEHLEDLVRCWDLRARAIEAAGMVEEDRHEALVRGERILRRRRAAALRVRAVEARRRRRLQASAAAGALPPLERIRAAHGLDCREVDALLAAGLGSHERFAARVQRAARLLPPAEMPLAAWIEALEAGAFPAG